MARPYRKKNTYDIAFCHSKPCVKDEFKCKHLSQLIACGYCEKFDSPLSATLFGRLAVPERLQKCKNNMVLERMAHKMDESNKELK